jgi:hypothetical protein
MRAMAGLMRKSISIGTGAAVAVILAHGMAFSAMNLSEPLPISTYRGFFQQPLFVMERLWSYVNGWPSMSHIRDFGNAYAHMVHLICPLIGFALFWIVSRHHVGTNVWKPMAIVMMLAVPPYAIAAAPFYALGFKEPWIEMARTLLVMLLMVWSVGAIRISRPHASTAESLATA